MRARTLLLVALGAVCLATGPADAQAPAACETTATGPEILDGVEVGLLGELENLEVETDFIGSFEAAAKPRNCVPASKCCKICSKGKACGNSCISRRYTCHKGRGCACNSSEVC
jgi:hypothetical protein